MIWELEWDGWFGWMGEAFLLAVVRAAFVVFILWVARVVLEHGGSRRAGRGVRLGPFDAATHAS